MAIKKKKGLSAAKKWGFLLKKVKKSKKMIKSEKKDKKSPQKSKKSSGSQNVKYNAQKPLILPNFQKKPLMLKKKHKKANI